MPNDSTVWIVLIVTAFIVVFVALWKGRGLKISKGKDGFSVETEAEKKQKSIEQNISVGKGIKITNVDAGDIAGIKSEDVDSASDAKQNIDVASNCKITNAKLGDIVGIKKERKSSKDKK